MSIDYRRSDFRASNESDTWLTTTLTDGSVVAPVVTGEMQKSGCVLNG